MEDIVALEKRLEKEQEERVEVCNLGRDAAQLQLQHLVIRRQKTAPHTFCTLHPDFNL